MLKAIFNSHDFRGGLGKIIYSLIPPLLANDAVVLLLQPLIKVVFNYGDACSLVIIIGDAIAPTALM